MTKDYEAEFEAALRSFEASGEFLIHVQCGPNTVALWLPRACLQTWARARAGSCRA